MSTSLFQLNAFYDRFEIGWFSPSFKEKKKKKRNRYIMYSIMTKKAKEKGVYIVILSMWVLKNV